MTDLSDGVAVGTHNIAEASGVGIDLRRDDLPTLPEADGDDIFVGEDYELLLTLPSESVEEARNALDEVGTSLSVVGEVIEEKNGVSMDGEPLERRGYEH
jgi:thiamine-monophosphate kinase